MTQETSDPQKLSRQVAVRNSSSFLAVFALPSRRGRERFAQLGQFPANLLRRRALHVLGRV